jgi:hypothetical protein
VVETAVSRASRHCCYGTRRSGFVEVVASLLHCARIGGEIGPLPI